MERTAALVTAIVALGLTGISGFWFIPWLRRLKLGQTINKIGPVWHQSKEGTPTMGGIMIVFGVVVAVIVGYVTLILEVPQFLSKQYAVENFRLFAGLIMALCFAGIGFYDDFMKIRHHQNLGLNAPSKLVLQTIVALLYTFAMYQWGELETALHLPFFGEVQLGYWYFPLSLVLIVGIVNAVNLTDGIDGLSSSVTFFVSLTFIVIAALLGYVGTSLTAIATAGACGGFVLWNFFPAKVFMGDTGSMFLGGLVLAMAYGVSLPFLILLCGVVYLCEAFSVMIQMTYYKITKGKRLFKMTPIHHHFEMSGWSEVKIVVVFGLVTLAAGALSVLAVLAM